MVVIHRSCAERLLTKRRLTPVGKLGSDVKARRIPDVREIPTKVPGRLAEASRMPG